MKTKLFALAGTVTALTAFIAIPALAAEPKTATLVTSVQNQTTNSAISDANDAEHAVTAKTGDILKYTITLTNAAKATIDTDNKLKKVTMTDSLPAGVELLTDVSSRSITENIDSIAASKSVTKTYLVRVTGKDGDIITNKACFTGTFEGEDDAEAACDDAIVKVAGAVTAPTTPVPTTPAPATPEPAATETPAVTPPAAATDTDGKLPTTGPGSTAATVALVIIAGAFAYASRMYLYTRKQAV